MNSIKNEYKSILNTTISPAQMGSLLMQEPDFTYTDFTYTVGSQ
jgi:hypothetical protein